MKGWIGVDLDGTIARYDHWRGEDHIGAPLPAMVERVKAWLAEGEEVRIFTARASMHGRSVEQRQANVARIKAWCLEHIGRELDVTSDKDWGMKELWDDRAVQVAVNTGCATSEMYDARIRAEARAEAAERAEMALALMFDMGQITRDKAVSMMRAAILADEPKEREEEKWKILGWDSLLAAITDVSANPSWSEECRRMATEFVELMSSIERKLKEAER